MVMLDHQGTHGPSLIWIRTMTFDMLRAHPRILSAFLPAAIVRIQTNVGWCDRRTRL